MKIEIDKVPPKGYIYSVGDELFFSAYSVVDGHILLPNGKSFNANVFTQAHFFDEKTEYRILCGTGKQRSFLLTEADDDNPDYVIIREDMWIRPEFCKGTQECEIAVINRFEYTDDDRLCLTSYRLAY